MTELTLNASPNEISGRLEVFHHQNGGAKLLPELSREDLGTSFMYSLIDDGAEATILLEPLDNGGCIMTVNINESELWGWRLGVPGRSELGVTTRLGSTTSERCKKFCDDFIESLEDAGYLDPPKAKGGAPRNPDLELARQRYYVKGWNKGDASVEYRNRRREKNPRLTIDQIDESFRKGIDTPPKTQSQ